MLGLDRGDGVAYAANQIGAARRGELGQAGRRCRSSPATRWSSCTSRRPRHDPRPGRRDAAAGLVRRGEEGDARRWKSWLTIFTMTEDDNEGVFGPPPATGNAMRHLPADARPRAAAVPADGEHAARLASCRTPMSRTSWRRDGLAGGCPWTNDVVGAYTVHPLASCRIGDDPATSALDDRHELRGHPGIFVTDGSAVPAR